MTLTAFVHLTAYVPNRQDERGYRRPLCGASGRGWGPCWRRGRV